MFSKKPSIYNTNHCYNSLILRSLLLLLIVTLITACEEPLLPVQNDTNPPVITLLGSNPLEVQVSPGGTFTDPGASATDDIDGDISDKIIVGGDSVDMSTPGAYLLTYDVDDSAGNAATQLSRTVVVLEQTTATDTTPPVITLLGANPLTINISPGGNFNDPGATAADDVDGDISNSIITSGDNVDIAAPGTYLVTYDVRDAAGNSATQVTRTVKVIEENNSATDTTAPIITLLGSNPLQVTQSSGESFTDPGATATDDRDGDISSDIIVGGDSVDRSTPGSYLLTYNVSDSAGNAATQVIRTVEVVADVADGKPWSYPAIPYTDWAYDPFTITLEAPAAWPGASAQNYYYVEPDHPNASDNVMGDELTGTYGRFGYPDRPRSSIPSDGWIGDVYEAGTVIWVKGGTYTRDDFHGIWSPQFHGTESQPVWLYGDPSDKPTFSGVNLRMYNSRHLIFDNFQWIGGNTSNGALALTRDRDGPTHHITLRRLRFENLDWIAGGGAIVGINASSNSGAEVHDVVAYQILFKNNGGGFDWTTVDNDHHGYKINGTLGGNGVRRIWIIENRAEVGEAPDPIDGLYKSLSGNLVQVGDQAVSSGNNHHVYVAGNYQEYARQALGWTKNSRDIIFSSNTCTNTYAMAGGNGQCYGHQYGLGTYNWWINNVGKESSSGWMHTANDPMEGPLFIIGNIFYGNRNSEANDEWRLCSGATLFTQQGEHYFVNNVFDNSCHGIWAGTNRNTNIDTLHIYNNIFTNISSTIDTRSRAVTLNDDNGLTIHMENNLFDTYSDSVYLNGEIATITDLNNHAWAAENIVGNIEYVNQQDGNYSVHNSSDAIDNGTTAYQSGATDVYQQFIDRYTNDEDYPGNPADYWPQDYLKQPRVLGDAIDIGPHEQQ